eukprot:1913236-Prymnesium_polylepis.1
MVFRSKRWPTVRPTWVGSGKGAPHSRMSGMIPSRSPPARRIAAAGMTPANKACTSGRNSYRNSNQGGQRPSGVLFVRTVYYSRGALGENAEGPSCEGGDAGAAALARHRRASRVEDAEWQHPQRRHDDARERRALAAGGPLIEDPGRNTAAAVASEDGRAVRT